MREKNTFAKRILSFLEGVLSTIMETVMETAIKTGNERSAASDDGSTA